MKYKRFWDDPTGTPLAWLAILYGIMSLAAYATAGTGDEIPLSRGTQVQMAAIYRRCCSQCLVLSNYTKPGPHTLVAFLLYLAGEFILSKDDQVSCFLLIGVAIRLALRLGLHRDGSKITGNISVFQAEMRRRTWHLLTQIDLLASFHIGLPGMVQAIESDTQFPRNLRDEDLDESSMALPPSRPESEMTPMSYTLCKGRLLGVFGRIAAEAHRLSMPPYEDVIKLDTDLNQIFDTIPDFFRVVPLEYVIPESKNKFIEWTI